MRAVMQKRLWAAGGLVVLLAAGIGLMLADRVDTTSELAGDEAGGVSEVYRRDLQKFRPQFMESQRALRQHEIFAEGSREADAGALFNLIFPWAATTPTIAPTLAALSAHARLLEQQGRRPLRVGSALRLKLAACGDECAATASLFTEDIDLGWMKEALRYDHWNFSAHSPFTHLRFDPEKDAFAGQSLPVLHWETVLDLARLRAIEGVREGDAESAHREIRHLAKLMLSTHERLLAMVAMRVLKVDATLPPHPDYPPISSELTKEAQHVFRHYPLSPWLEVAEIEQLFQEAPLGRCHAMSEFLIVGVVVRPLLYDRYGAFFEWFDERMRANDCDLAGMRPFWNLWAKGFPSAYYRDLLGSESPFTDKLAKYSVRAADLEHQAKARHVLGEVLLGLHLETFPTD
jgi:hypothetical protein